ncbi:MAG: glycosyltransferase N-terminal domain-containing protein [Deltaproteobacteria bacterium]
MSAGLRRALGAYNCILVVVAAALFPVWVVFFVLRPRFRRGLACRLGIGWPTRVADEVLWAHAASVGEVEGLAPLVRRWSQAHPAAQILFTSLTETGVATAARLLPAADTRLAPLDLPGLPARLVHRLRPTLFLFSENELWPNLLAAMARESIPTVQVSGRLSAGAARLLGRVPRFTAVLLACVSRFLLQSNADRDRLLSLGVAEPRLFVTGSLKGSGERPSAPAALASLASHELIVAGSTHPGEEEILLDAIRALRQTHADLLWLLAPRNPERFAEVAGLLAQCGIPFVRRTELRGARLGPDIRIVLLDTVGELAGCYGLARVAFVGGSLVPIGGHNLLEPARFGVPIVTGQYLQNVEVLAERLTATGALRRAANAVELAAEIEHFLHLPAEAGVADAARSVAAESTSALEDTWRALEHPKLAGAFA